MGLTIIQSTVYYGFPNLYLAGEGWQRGLSTLRYLRKCLIYLRNTIILMGYYTLHYSVTGQSADWIPSLSLSLSLSEKIAGMNNLLSKINKLRHDGTTMMNFKKLWSRTCWLIFLCRVLFSDISISSLQVLDIFVLQGVPKNMGIQWRIRFRICYELAF